MESKTQNHLSPAQIEALVARHFDYHGPIETTELTGGMMNAIYRLSFGGREMVLKVGARPDEPLLLSYEHGLTRTEALSLREYGAAGVPVPALLAEDFQHDITGSDCLFLSVAPGQPVSALLPGMDEAQKDHMRFQMGRALALMHRVRGEKFGYAHPTAEFESWPKAFFGMFNTLLDDLEARGADVPIPALRNYLVQEIFWLTEVTTPVLVNFDLWEANMFALPGADGQWELSAVLDFERGFFGDPAADFVALNRLYFDIDEAPALLAGYRSVDPSFAVTGPMRRRMRLYRLYLALVITGELPRYDAETAAGMGYIANLFIDQILSGEPVQLPKF